MTGGTVARNFAYLLAAQIVAGLPASRIVGLAVVFGAVDLARLRGDPRPGGGKRRLSAIARRAGLGVWSRRVARR